MKLFHWIFPLHLYQTNVAAAIVGSAVVGGAVASSSASKAAKAQQAAADSASGTQLYMYEQSREDQEPWREAGRNALTQLSSGVAPGGDLLRNFGLSDFEKDPGYDFRMAEGMKGITNSAAARGGLLSGAALKAAGRYNQEFASNEFGNAYNRFNNNQTNKFNRLASLAGVGQQAATQIGNQGIATGNQIAQNQIGAGNARASGYIGQSNALTGAIGQGWNMYQGNQMLNTLQNQGGYYPYGGSNFDVGNVS